MFKVGDRVKIIKNICSEMYEKYVGTEHEIVGVDKENLFPYTLPIYAITDDGKEVKTVFTHWVDEELELVNNEKN